MDQLELMSEHFDKNYLVGPLTAGGGPPVEVSWGWVPPLEARTCA